MKLRNAFPLCAAAVTIVSAPLAGAFTYHDLDLLLVFRKDGFNDTEFNLGSVSQFLNLPNGKEVSVGGWDLNQVKANYDLTDDVRVVLLASTSSTTADKRVWLTSSDASATVLDRTASQWQVVQSKLNAIGAKLQEFTANNSANFYVISPTVPASYTYIVSNRGSTSSLLPKLGGDVAFTVETTIPGTLWLYEIKPSAANPKPKSTLAGSFAIGEDGSITFHRGAAETPLSAATIASVGAQGGTVTVTFHTVAGAQYRLRHSDRAAGAVATWATGTEVVLGTGGDASLHDTAGNVAGRFYVVETFR